MWDAPVSGVEARSAGEADGRTSASVGLGDRRRGHRCHVGRELALLERGRDELELGQLRHGGGDRHGGCGRLGDDGCRGRLDRGGGLLDVFGGRRDLAVADVALVLVLVVRGGPGVAAEDSDADEDGSRGQECEDRASLRCHDEVLPVVGGWNPAVC
ncbi:MAG: hypothetical protein QG658_13 [Patescibacteria group bacterium]|nr:hypothetical protein [Patescibacteria group bacterium]